MKIVLLFLCCYLLDLNFSDSGKVISSQEGKGKKESKEKKGKKGEAKKKSDDGKPKTRKPHPTRDSSRIEILKTWSLPTELTEISGMVLIDDNTMACIQDESGIIFLYDLKGNKVSSRINFAGAGDYEGIAYDGHSFFVMRSDGAIFKVSKSTEKTEILRTGLSIGNDCEGLFYQVSSKRLLIVCKGKEPFGSANKGVYEYDPVTERLAEKPVISIDPSAAVFRDTLKKKENLNALFQPSEIAVDPVSGNYYFTNGGRSALLVADNNGRIKLYTPLRPVGLTQPEGIAFSQAGELYISSEGGKGKGVIVKCKLK